MKISIAIALLSLASCAPKRSTVEPQIDQGPIAHVYISDGEECVTIRYPLSGLSSLADVAKLLPKRALFNVLPDGVDFFTVEPVEALPAFTDYDERIVYKLEPSMLLICSKWGTLEIKDDSNMPETSEGMRMNLESDGNTVILRFRMPESEQLRAIARPGDQLYKALLYRLRLKEVILGALAKRSCVSPAPSIMSLSMRDRFNPRAADILFSQDLKKWEF